MNGHGWKDYLTFTKKERTGVIVLLALIMIIYAVPEFLPEKPPLQVFYNNDSLKSATKQFTYGSSEKEEELERNDPDYGRSESKNSVVSKFEFDPNTLQEEGWHRLGVADRTIKTIMNFRAKGGKFRAPEDLRKVYGLNKSLCEELIPFVRIKKISSTGFLNDDNESARKVEANIGKSTYKGLYQPRDSGFYKARYNKYSVSLKSVDINTADSALWEQLPGIGGKLASRIILFRERLGGFYNVQQVAETFGISDSTFRLILPYLRCGETTLRKTNINNLPAQELTKHPYIRWSVANAIVNYRNQHGSFRNVSDLRSVTAIPPDVFQKLEPYLTVK